MSTIEATVSMLEVMPEDARLLVLDFTQQLFISRKPESPYKPLTLDSVLDDLRVSREQNQGGKGINMKSALDEMGKCHGFV